MSKKAANSFAVFRFYVMSELRNMNAADIDTVSVSRESNSDIPCVPAGTLEVVPVGVSLV